MAVAHNLSQQYRNYMRYLEGAAFVMLVLVPEVQPLLPVLLWGGVGAFRTLDGRTERWTDGLVTDTS